MIEHDSSFSQVHTQFVGEPQVMNHL